MRLWVCLLLMNAVSMGAIRSPVEGGRYEAGKAIIFETEHLEEGVTCHWYSDVAGDIADGRRFQAILHEVGDHFIYLMASDRSGFVVERDMVYISIVEGRQPGIELPAHKQVNDEKKSKPEIREVNVPKIGQNGKITGLVAGVDPEMHDALVLLRVDNEWHARPDYSRPYTRIGKDGRFECKIGDKAEDEFADMVCVSLIRKGKGTVQSQFERCLTKKLVARQLDFERLTYDPNEINGLCYNPHLRPRNEISKAELEEDIQFLAKVTGKIRTYACQGVLTELPRFCDKYGLDCLIGVKLVTDEEENQRELQSLNVTLQGNWHSIKAIIVGDSVYENGIMNMQKHQRYIQRVKSMATGIPVCSADSPRHWLSRRELVSELDFIMLNNHPFWEGVTIEKAKYTFFQKLNYLKTMYGDKRIVVGETGWPSGGTSVGEAVPSPRNQKRFFEDVLIHAGQTGIEYFFLSAFDEPWRTHFEGEEGAHFGLFYKDGTLKPANVKIVPALAWKGVKR